MSIFTDLFSTKAADKAAAARKAGLEAGYGQATDLYGQGRTALQGAYGNALSTYQPLLQTAGRSFDLAGDITGANGAEGSQRARDAFTASPGYQWGVDQALEAVKRGAAGTGMLASGNTLTALQDRATNLANQEYGNWANRALTMAGMAPGLASGEAGIYTGLGNAMLGSYGQQGDLAFKTQSGMGEANAAAALDAQRASGQFWNTLLGGAGLALKASGWGGFGAPTKAA